MFSVAMHGRLSMIVMLEAGISYQFGLLDGLEE
jgi:hypothetical protein